jgi:hypothetical protein
MARQVVENIDRLLPPLPAQVKRTLQACGMQDDVVISLAKFDAAAARDGIELQARLEVKQAGPDALPQRAVLDGGRGT